MSGLVDRFGRPLPEPERVRLRLGFLGGDHLPADSGGGVTSDWPTSRAEFGYLRGAHKGDYDETECRRGRSGPG